MHLFKQNQGAPSSFKGTKGEHRGQARGENFCWIPLTVALLHRSHLHRNITVTELLSTKESEIEPMVDSELYIPRLLTAQLLSGNIYKRCSWVPAKNGRPSPPLVHLPVKLRPGLLAG